MGGGDGQNTVVGSVFWMAPEMLRGDKDVTTAIDIWSFGCCLVEMVTAMNPWAEQQLDNIFHACRFIVESSELPKLPDGIDRGLRELVYLCLQRDPAARVTAASLRQQAWREEK